MGSGGRWVSGWTKVKLMLNSNPVEDVVEVGVELGKSLKLSNIGLANNKIKQA